MFLNYDMNIVWQVSGSVDEYGVSGLFIYFEDVPIAKLDEIGPKLWEVLRSVDEKTLDMDRMRTILRRRILDMRAMLESRPHRALARTVNTLMVYGSKPEEVGKLKMAFVHIQSIYQLMFFFAVIVQPERI